MSTSPAARGAAAASTAGSAFNAGRSSGTGSSSSTASTSKACTTSSAKNASPMARRRARVVDPQHPDRSRELYLPVEEPLEIRLDGQAIAMVSRTPGHDIELIHGYLLGEGFIGGREDVRGARYCEGSVLSQDTGFSQNTYNVISVQTENPVIRLAGPVSRECGQPSVDALDIIPPVRIAEDPTIVTAASIRAIAAELVRRSGISPYTAASLTLTGTATTRDDARQLLAVDKVLGWAAVAGLLPLEGAIVCMEGGADASAVSHCVRAGVPIVIGLGAPTSLACDIAKHFGVTLVSVHDAAPEPEVLVWTVPDRIE